MKLLVPILALALFTPLAKAAPRKKATLPNTPAFRPLIPSQIAEIRRRIALLQPGEKDPIGQLKIKKYIAGTVDGRGPIKEYRLTYSVGSNCYLTITEDETQKPPRFLSAYLGVTPR